MILEISSIQQQLAAHYGTAWSPGVTIPKGDYIVHSLYGKPLNVRVHGEEGYLYIQPEDFDTAAAIDTRAE